MLRACKLYYKHYLENNFWLIILYLIVWLHRFIALLLAKTLGSLWLYPIIFAVSGIVFFIAKGAHKEQDMDFTSKKFIKRILLVFIQGMSLFFVRHFSLLMPSFAETYGLKRNTITRCDFDSTRSLPIRGNPANNPANASNTVTASSTASASNTSTGSSSQQLQQNPIQGAEAVPEFTKQDFTDIRWNCIICDMKIHRANELFDEIEEHYWIWSSAQAYHNRLGQIMSEVREKKFADKMTDLSAMAQRMQNIEKTFTGEKKKWWNEASSDMIASQDKHKLLEERFRYLSTL